MDASGAGDGARAAPLEGIRVLDFSTLLPGPLAGLLLAEAGADVVKVERPGSGDEMRAYQPRFGSTSANFAVLNRGKSSIVLDLKDPDDLAQALRLAGSSDVLIEQFRPGVMSRLGLGYETLSEANPRLVYCSISGYGQDGPRAGQAGHDLNYCAETGLLDLVRDTAGEPALPPVLLADIAGGAYPAVMNVLLALAQRERTGRGAHLDVSMAGNLLTLQYWALAQAGATGRWPRPGAEQVTGGSPRYQLYRTADGEWLAAAPLEQRFWDRFCALIGLPEDLRDDARDAETTRAAVAERVAAHEAAHWERVFDGEDACATVLRSLEDAVRDPQFAPLVTERLVRSAGRTMPALPVPLCPPVRTPGLVADAPGLGDPGPSRQMAEPSPGQGG